MNNVTFETQAAEGSIGRCPIQLQRETPGGLVDGVCGSEAPPNFAGLCKCANILTLCSLLCEQVMICDHRLIISLVIISEHHLHVM